MDELEDAITGYWSTAISDIAPGVIRMHGYPIEQLIGEVTFSEMIWVMLRGERPTPGEATLLEAALVAAVDHGTQAPSIAAARMAVSCGLPINSAMATGANLLGDIHGGAGQQCMEIFDQVLALTSGSDPSLTTAVRTVISGLRDQGRLLPGFGHRFHPRDPRRDPLIALTSGAAERGEVAGRYLAVALEVERQLGTDRDRTVPMNIDGATATIYAELGFAPEQCRGLFVLSRSVGILAHSWEERQGGRRIKGPLPPPLLGRYTGPQQRNVESQGPDRQQ